MLIDDFTPEIYTPPCGPNPELHAVRAHLPVDISAVLPYLNATLRGATYYPGQQALIWRNAGHRTAFHAQEIAVSDIVDRDTAGDEIQAAVDLVNSTWERRAEITPDTTSHQRPTAMGAYKLLPRTNCKLCGEPTCFVFAGKLVAGQRQVADCPPLADQAQAAPRAALADMLDGWV